MYQQQPTLDTFIYAEISVCSPVSKKTKKKLNKGGSSSRFVALQRAVGSGSWLHNLKKNHNMEIRGGVSKSNITGFYKK